MQAAFAVSGMHCPMCVKRLTDAFHKVPGVRSAHVTLNPPEAHIVSVDGVARPRARPSRRAKPTSTAPGGTASSTSSTSPSCWRRGGEAGTEEWISLTLSPPCLPFVGQCLLTTHR
jgi:copper chaperone CopZ